MFSTQDFKELSALHKAILAAKFSGRTINDELAGDPTLAGVSDKLYDALAKAGERRKFGPDDYWQDWRRINTSQGFRGQWRTAVIAARRDPLMQSASHEERLSMAKCYLSPFTCTEKELAAFLDEVEGRIGEHDLTKLSGEHSFMGASLLECSCGIADDAHIVFMLKNSKVCDIFFSGVKNFSLSAKSGSISSVINTVSKISMSSGKSYKLEAELTDGRNKKSLLIESESAEYWI